MPGLNHQPNLIGLIGKPLGHSLSPRLHEISFQQMGIEARYVPIEIDADQLAATLERTFTENFLGLNVTAPYKKAVARLIGSSASAVNTLSRGESGWIGGSTDIEGLDRALKRTGFSLSGFSKMVVLGNGGVVDSLLEFLRDKKISPEIVVFRRSAIRDAELSRLAGNVNLRLTQLSPVPLRQELAGRADETLLLQATSAPLHGDALLSLAPTLDDFRGVVIDCVYGRPSALVQRARDLRLACDDGLSMLIEQALLAQRSWFGESAGFLSVKNQILNLVKYP